MPATIFLLDSDDSLTALEESGFSAEDDLQRLLATNPDLLAGDQIAPEDPLRWLLVTREAAIADGESGTLRWSVDHLFLDHHGVPTLVEVKRASNPQVRREVVGQLFEYAANAALTWLEGDLRRVVEDGCQAAGREPDEVMSETLGVVEPDDYWSKVDDNLRLGVLTVFLGTVSFNILPVGPAIVLTCILGAQYFLLGSAALNRLKDVKSYYVALSSARASSEGDDRGRQVREYVESYRHLREHGNAFLVLLLEVALAYVLLCVCDAAQAVWIIILWIFPGACSWFIATTLEIRFVHQP